MDEHQVQIDPGILIETQRERITALTNENVMLVAYANQLKLEISSLQQKEAAKDAQEDG